MCDRFVWLICQRMLDGITTVLNLHLLRENMFTHFSSKNDGIKTLYEGEFYLLLIYFLSKLLVFELIYFIKATTNHRENFCRFSRLISYVIYFNVALID